MKYIIENVMISLMVLSFCIGLFQLYYLNKFTERLIKCLNIFIRVNQTEAYNEFVFTKDILDILNHPSETYINLNCTEKVINKKALRIIDQEIMNSNRSSKTDKNNNKKKNAKNNFSFHNIRNFSRGYSIFFTSFIFLLLFAFLFSNYYYFTITYTQIVNLIDLSIIFGKLSTVPPTAIALNRICLREKIVSNSLYDYPRNFERETLFYNTLLDSINELGSIITVIPKYSANSDSMNNEILRVIIYGSETSDMCQELLKVNILNQERSDLCQRTLNRAFSKNLLSTFGSLIVALREEFALNIPIDFSDETKRAAQRELIYINLKSTAGLERILSEYFLLKIIFYFNEEMEKFYTNLMKTYMNTLQVIVLGTTISLIIFFLILTFLTNSYLKSLYDNITLILNIIPYEKIANDEQTNFLIKKYWRD